MLIWFVDVSAVELPLGVVVVVVPVGVVVVVPVLAVVVVEVAVLVDAVVVVVVDAVVVVVVAVDVVVVVPVTTGLGVLAAVVVPAESTAVTTALSVDPISAALVV